MKKVLIITYYWPPSGGAGVQRWVKFVKYLRKFNWEPIVYIPENPHYPVLDKSFNKDIPPDITILKYPIWEPYTIYKKFMGMKKEEKVQHGFIQEEKRSTFKQNISNWIRSNFFIPDARKFWIKPSIKYLTKYFMQHEKPDVIVSTGPPHSMHLIAMGLKKKLDIPWIADFRDPWTGIDFYSQLKLTKRADKKHHKLEKAVLQNADKVIAVGWNMAKELEALGAGSVDIITNGYDDTDFSNIETQNPVNSNKFVLSHIGSLNRDRNPETLWEAISELIKENKKFNKLLQIKLIGKIDIKVIEYLKKYNLQDYYVKIDYVSHKNIPEILQKSNILLLLLNNTPNIESIITGKIFEYIASKRPILCIGSSTGDASKILKDSKSGRAFDFEDKNGIKSFIIKRFKCFINQECEDLNSEDIEKYSRKNLTAKLAEMLNSVCL